MRHNLELESARHLFAVLALFVGPCLVVLASRGWVRHRLSGLPRWRDFLGLASIVLVGFSWLLVISLNLFALVGAGDLLSSYMFLDVICISSALALLTSLALRGFPRLLTAGASLLVFTFIWGGIYY